MKKDEFWYCDGSVPMLGGDREYELHLFSSAASAVQTVSPDAALSAIPLINIYPRDACPCSARAKPLSSKVIFSSSPQLYTLSSFFTSPLHNSRHSSAKSQRTAEYLQQLSRVLNRATARCRSEGVEGLGFNTVSSYRIFLRGHMGVWSDCQGRLRPSITIN